MQIIDAQIHVWGSGLPSNLAHRQVTAFPPAEAIGLMDAGGVDAAVIHPPGWDPGATPMERVDAVTWEITVPFAEGEQPQYKFTRGSWEAVEKDANCGEIPNRTAVIAFGADGTQLLEHEVGKWRDLDDCG